MRPYGVPIEEIKFAAKSGFLSKKVWDLFFNNHTQGWSSVRWKGFQTRGIFKPHQSPLLKNCLVLNPLSPIVTQLIDGAVCSPPSPVQLSHDENVARIVLTLLKREVIKDYLLEPELKRIYNSLGNSKKRKFPDAIFDLYTIEKTIRIALEVEQSKKSPRRYQRFLEASCSNEKINGIVIAHSSEKIKSLIEKEIVRINFPTDLKPIVFIELEKLFDTKNAVTFFKNFKKK